MEIGLCQARQESYFEISKKYDLLGHVSQVAYVDVRLVPKSSLLYEMNELEFDVSFLMHIPRSISTASQERGQASETPDHISSPDMNNLYSISEKGTTCTINKSPAGISAVSDNVIWIRHSLGRSFLVTIHLIRL